MSGHPPSWVEESTSRAPRLVALTADIAAREVDVDAGWRRVLETTARPRSAWRMVPALVASMTVGALGVLAIWPKVHAPMVLQVQAANDARWHVQGEEVVVDSGHAVFQASSGQVLKVATPHLRLQVFNGRVAADVAAERTVLWVQEGQAVVNTRDGERVLRSGASLSWPPVAEISERLTPAPSPQAVCEASPPEALVQCLELESQGTSLRAEEALYELGLLQSKSGHGNQAVETLRRSLERFPEGALHPEVRLLLMIELAHQQRVREATEVALGFEAACADDPRVVEVVRLRRSLNAGR